MFFDTTLEERLEELVESHKAAIQEFAQKLVDDADKPEMLRHHFSWSSNHIRIAAKCQIFHSYLVKLRYEQEQRGPFTPEENIALHEDLRTKVLGHLTNKSRSIANTSTLPSSNETNRAVVEALSGLLEDTDWYLTRLRSNLEKGEAA